MSHEQAKQTGGSAPQPALPRELPVRGAVARAEVIPSEEPTLAGHVWTVLEHWPTALAIFLVCLAAGAFYAFTTTPIYHVDTVVQVEAKSKGLAGLEELLPASGGPAETEIAIIRSRSALNAVVDEFNLDLEVAPRRFPLVGGALARRYKGVGPAPARFGAPRFAWGGERLRVRRLDVPDELLELPLRLTATAKDAYRLEDEEGTLLLEGKAGALASGTVGERRLELFVTELVARPGTEFRVVKRRRADVVSGLRRQLRVAEEGKLSGILVISMDGADPVRTAAILDAVANNYVRQNVDRKSAEAAQQLSFLESQLPVVKSSVNEAEAAFNKFMGTHGSVNLSSETQAVLDRAAEIERELTGLELQRSELRQRFTPNHPTLASLNEKMQMLRGERTHLNARMQRMPEAEANSARLQRDMRVSTELYNLLLNKTQELRIVKSGTVGNVRVLDPAVAPLRPSWPRKSAVLALSALAGVLGAVAGAFVRKALSQGAKDAEDIEASTGLAVYATVPHSDAEQALIRTRRGGGSGVPTVLATVDPQDPTVESLRSLRTSLQFALVEARNNVISVSGPSPGIGKSFVCANLAAVLATPERRVLVIDADLRRGRIHHFFGLERRPGLSDVLGETATLAAALRRTTHASVDILPTGSVPPNAAELLSTHRFQVLLEGVARTYAYVIVDTPPALAVTDATVVARLTGVNLLVLKSGAHTMREIALCVKRYAQSGATVHGAVLNDVRATLGRYGRHGRYQRYDYKSDGA